MVSFLYFPKHTHVRLGIGTTSLYKNKHKLQYFLLKQPQISVQGVPINVNVVHSFRIHSRQTELRAPSQKQDRQCTYNLTLSRGRVTIVAMEKQ
jgi:hypothetical protein